MSDYITAYQLARKLNVSAVSVYKWVKKGCPHVKQQEGLREVMYFDLDEVNRWIEDRKKK